MNGAWDITVTVMTMPWGKHKGKLLSEVPPDYLRWALKNADSMSSVLRGEIERVLGILSQTNGSATTRPRHETEVDRHRVLALEQDVINLRKQIDHLQAELKDAQKFKMSDSVLFRRIIKQWFGAMSRKFHPDLGGDVTKQTVLNQCHSDIIRRLEECERSNSNQ